MNATSGSELCDSVSECVLLVTRVRPRCTNVTPPRDRSDRRPLAPTQFSPSPLFQPLSTARSFLMQPLHRTATAKQARLPPSVAPREPTKEPRYKRSSSFRMPAGAPRRTPYDAQNITRCLSTFSLNIQIRNNQVLYLIQVFESCGLVFAVPMVDHPSPKEKLK